MEHLDYEVLAAAHLLRSPRLAASFGPLVKATQGRLFQDVFLRDVVLYGLGYFTDTGKLLPPSALKVDTRLFGREEISRDNYDTAIDQIFSCPEETLERTKDHVTGTLVEETQTRLLLQTDLSGYMVRGKLEGLWKALEAIKSLKGYQTNGEVKRLQDGLLDVLRDPPRGVPTGIPELDACLPAGGPAPGETLMYYGRYAIGKSIVMAHSVRHSALQGRITVFWAVGDGSTKTLFLRLAKGFLGWTDQQLRANPEKAYRLFMDRFDGLPLYPLWSSPGKTDKARISAVLDSVEQKEGRKVDLLAMDYSEKRAKDRDWMSVCGAYEELRDLCGERGVVGLDAAQENQSGKISYFNLLRDADFGIQLTVLPPSDWRRRQGSMRAEDKEPPEIPTRGPVWGEIIRAREGVSNVVFELWVDRELGQVRSRQRGGEVGK